MPIPGAYLMQRVRARTRGFFGLDLPKRDLDLGFELLAPSRRGKKPPRSGTQLVALLQANRSTPQEFLERHLSVTRGINRYSMSTKRREALTDVLADTLYPEIAAALREIARQGRGIPEQSGRRGMLELYERCVRALTESYQLIFAGDYRRGRFRYARIRPRAYRSACRVLELIKLHHRIIALRYMSLPPATCRIANTVFMAMRACEPVDSPVDALSARSQALDGRITASLQNHYVSLLSYSILDYSAWPEPEQFFMDNYCSAIRGAIRFHDYDPNRPQQPKDHVVVGCYQETPPARGLPQQIRPGPALVIDYSVLGSNIREDYAALSRARADRNRFSMPARLQRLEPGYQTAAAYLLYRNLEWPEKPADMGGRNHRRRHDLRIYTGVAEVRAHLLAIFRGGGRPQRSRELSNLFARRSTVIGEDHAATRESLWHVLDDNEEQLRIKTQETRFTDPMFIGNLIAYGFGTAEIHKPRIGKVNRIFRPEAGSVVIDIEYLANFATPIALYKRNPATEIEPGKIKVVGKPLPALLLHHPTRGWGVIMPPQELVWERTPVGIQTGKRVATGELAEARDVTNEFHWFQVASSSFPSKAPDYPEPREHGETEATVDSA